MSEQKKDRGIIDFNDMEHLALDILVKNLNQMTVLNLLKEHHLKFKKQHSLV